MLSKCMLIVQPGNFSILALLHLEYKASGLLLIPVPRHLTEARWLARRMLVIDSDQKSARCHMQQVEGSRFRQLCQLLPLALPLPLPLPPFSLKPIAGAK